MGPTVRPKKNRQMGTRSRVQFGSRRFRPRAFFCGKLGPGRLGHGKCLLRQIGPQKLFWWQIGPQNILWRQIGPWKIGPRQIGPRNFFWRLIGPGKYTLVNMLQLNLYIVIGYILPTIGGYMSIGGCVCTRRAQGH